MMARLILWWLIWTAILTVGVYIVDRQTKQEVGKWSKRIAYVGAAVAVVLGLIIFLERL